MISIHVGDGSCKAFHVQQSTLEDACPYFAKALQDKGFREGQQGYLNFPHDDLEAWEMLLYWIRKQGLPRTLYDLDPLITCWVMGDKYGIPGFQDAVMLEMLRIFEHRAPKVREVAYALEHTANGSILRKLLVQQLADGVYESGGTTIGEVEENIMGYGVLGEWMEACKLLEQDSGVFSWPFSQEQSVSTKREGRASWRDYLIGQPPAQHWVYEYIRVECNRA